MEQEKRSAVIELFCTGHQSKDIAKLLNYHPKTVYRIIQRYKDMGTSQRKEHIPRDDKKRSPRFLVAWRSPSRPIPAPPCPCLPRTAMCLSIPSPGLWETTWDTNPLSWESGTCSWTPWGRGGWTSAERSWTSWSQLVATCDSSQMRRFLLWTCPGTGRMTGGSARRLPRSPWCSGPSTQLPPWSEVSPAARVM